MTGVTGVTPASTAPASTAPASTTPTTTTPTTTDSNFTSTVDKDMFLKLLVAQLRYQDPSNPVDSSQFLSQTAQFSMVEQLAAMTTSQESALTAQRMATASSLIGRTITYTNSDDQSVTGVVTGASFSGSTPAVKVGDTDVPLSSVKEVAPAS